MYFLRRFDPWKGKYCTCKPKYSLAPYTGCDHRCLYCYITTYIPQAFNCRPKSNFLKLLERDLEKADNSIPISISNSSDPYPTIEKKFRLTREALKVLVKFDFKVLLVTKSDLFLEDLDLIAANDIVITVTINNIDDNLTKILEPGAPAPSRRILAVGQLIDNSIPVMVRVDPIIPGLNENVEPLLERLSDVGVKDITTSTYKARPDSINRLKTAFPRLADELEKHYLEAGEFVNRSWYLPATNRERLMKNVQVIAKKNGLRFNMCREGLGIGCSTGSCDGQHLFDE